jgi:protein-S-isoprenylcysteine O-methyltransferase Ste14
MKNNLIKTFIIRLILGIIVVGLILFLPAGTLRYWQAWLYMSVIFIPIIFVVFYFLKNDPSILKRRMNYKEKQKEQKSIITLSGIIFFIGFVIPGFDYRYQWSNVPFFIVLITNALVLLGYIFVFFVFKENSYASRIIEVEKGQKVITTGPYKIVRHPMYLGVLLMFLATPLALGSYVALIAYLLLPVFIVLRILNEEKVLIKKLKGYKEYCKITKYRLIPGVW